MNNANKNNIRDFLGQQVKAPDTYSPELLRTEARIDNRRQYDINESYFEDKGYDIWNNWEVSFLLNNGKPVVGIAKIMFNANSVNIIESKSLKLYFNSFNMHKMGETVEEATKLFLELTMKDLSAASGKPVQVVFFTAAEAQHLQNYSGSMQHLLNDQTVLLDNVGLAVTQVEHFNEAPEVLQVRETPAGSERSFYGFVLRSNCKVTHAPDTGDIYIRYESNHKLVDEKSLLLYILSVRKESHFHEEILECIYKRLHDLLQPKRLLVAAFYNRRGSLDINPVRYSNKEDCAEWIDNLQGYSSNGFATQISRAIRQ